MNTTLRISAIATLAALVACNQAPPPADATATTPAPATTPAQPPTAPVTDTVPDRFRGEWNTETAACGTDHESRLVLDADAVRFHESSGPVTSVVDAGDELAITVQLAGEGEATSRRYRYRLGANGNALTDLDAALSRTRCPSTDRQVASN